MKLSIVIATYNRSRAVLRALKSIIAQTAPASQWECIVVNNNSSDTTESDVRAFIAEHADFNIVLVNEPEQGLSHARNCGIRHASGEYIAIIDDDETVVPEFADAYIRFFDDGIALAAGGPVIPRYETGKRPAFLSLYTERIIANPIYLGRSVRAFPASRIPAGGNMAFRREVFSLYGNFATSLGRKGNALTGGEESEFFQRLRAIDEQLYYVPKAAIYHYIPKYKLTEKYFRQLCFDVGRSKRVRAEMHDDTEALFASESRKHIYTTILSIYYTLTFRPEKAHWLRVMRKQIYKGILAAGER